MPCVTSEDTPLVFSAGTDTEISVFDVDAGSSPLLMTLAVTNGTLTLAQTTGLTFTEGDGTEDASMEFSGSQSAINAALNGMQFTPSSNFVGQAELDIEVDDQGNSGEGGALTDTATVIISVTAVNDAPVITVPSAQSVDEDGTLTLSTGNGNLISIADVDVSSSALQVIVSVTNGTLTLAQTTGLTFTSGDGTTDATMTFTGTLTNINAALDGLQYDPTADYNGSALLSIQVSDQGATGSGGAQSDGESVAITVNAVNDAPELDDSGVFVLSSINEDDTDSDGDTVAAIIASAGGDRITDADGDPEGIAVIAVDDANGEWQYNAGGAGWTAFGSVGADSAVLLDANDLIRFVPDAEWSGTSDFDFRAWDQSSGASGDTSVDTTTNGNATAFSVDTATATITVASVNDPPVVTKPADQSVVYGSSLTFSTGNSNLISLADADHSNLTLTMTVPVGTLTLASTSGLTGSGDGTSTLSYSGSITDLNTALDGLVYATATSGGFKTLSITATDAGSLADNESVNITVKAATDFLNDGSTTGYHFKRTTEAALVPTTGPFWVSVWFLVDAYVAGFGAALVDKRSAGGGYSLDVPDSGGRKVRLHVRDSGGSLATIFSTGPLATGTWYCAQMYHDPDNDVLGIRAGTGDGSMGAWQTTAHNTNIGTTTLDLLVGAGQGIEPRAMLNGRLDSLAIAGASGAAIPTADEWTELATSGARYSTLSDALKAKLGNGAFYDFDAGTGVDARSGLDLTATGSFAVVAGKA